MVLQKDDDNLSFDKFLEVVESKILMSVLIGSIIDKMFDCLLEIHFSKYVNCFIAC